ncbi:MAG TPA: ComF family protein [Candidatus Didemnitutus sp.]|nr:ComF family protein [Candidatus Didemnitutus sp.]
MPLSAHIFGPGISAAKELLFPRSCVNCANAVEEGTFRHLCGSCESRLRYATGACCTTCGHPFDGAMEVGRICSHCELLVPVFDEGRTAVLLRGSGRSLVHALKYHHGLHVLEDVTTIMRHSPGYADFAAGARLVPVPLHPRKQRERGYNQSELLARCVMACASRTQMAPMLRRVVDTVSQTAFDRAARQENLKNAFALASGSVISSEDRYLIVDDVFTTGSTLNACAAVLRRAGALRVDVLTFGHG